MNEPRWYAVNAAGNMHACVDEEGARQKVMLFDAHNSEFGPHRAVQLVDAAELEQANLLIEKQANEIEALRTGDTCGRSCEGQAYRIEARSMKAEIAQANLLIEQQAQEIEALKAVSKEMARVGMQQRNDLADARDQIEALRNALTEIAEWTDRYTSPGHPVSTVAKRALTGE